MELYCEFDTIFYDLNVKFASWLSYSSENMEERWKESQQKRNNTHSNKIWNDQSFKWSSCYWYKMIMITMKLSDNPIRIFESNWFNGTSFGRFVGFALLESPIVKWITNSNMEIVIGDRMGLMEINICSTGEAILSIIRTNLSSSHSFAKGIFTQPTRTRIIQGSFQLPNMMISSSSQLNGDFLSHFGILDSYSLVWIWK